MAQIRPFTHNFSLTPIFQVNAGKPDVTLFSFSISLETVHPLGSRDRPNLFTSSLIPSHHVFLGHSLGLTCSSFHLFATLHAVSIIITFIVSKSSQFTFLSHQTDSCQSQKISQFCILDGWLVFNCTFSTKRLSCHVKLKVW